MRLDCRYEFDCKIFMSCTYFQTLISTFSELVKEGEHAEKIGIECLNILTTSVICSILFLRLDTCHVWQKYTIGAHLCTMCSKYIWMARSSGFVCKGISIGYSRRRDLII